MISELLQCPNCGGLVDVEANAVTCTICSTVYPIDDGVPVFTPPSPPDDGAFDYREHYAIDNDVYDYFEERGAATSHEERRLHQTVIRHVPHDARRILDVGCGGAWVAEAYLPKDREVWSLDITAVNPKRALARHPSSRHHGVAADALKLPFKDASFDCVIAAEIIEHVVDPRAFVESLMRVVKPGGELIVTTPYRERIRETLCIHCNRLTPMDAHLHSFDEDILLGLYDGADLESASWTTFSNKAMTILRTHVVMQHVPYPAWKLTDLLMNRVTRKPHRILVAYRKRPGVVDA